MLAAWIPGPAMVLALVVGAPRPALCRSAADEARWFARWRPSRRSLVGRLVLFGVVALVVSLSWMVITDLVPAKDRPYIGGSTDNSVHNLAFAYNGFGRVDGNQGRAPGGIVARPQGIQPQTPPSKAPTNATRGGPFRGANGAGGIIAGTPGLLRMFDAANGSQIAWLLPFALLGGALSLWAARRRPLHRAVVVAFVGWVVLYAGVFSFARGIYHSYYTSALAPGLAALTGIAAVTMVELLRRDRRWLVAVAACALITLAVQFELEARVPQFYGWMRPLAMLGVAAGLASLWVLAWRRSAVWSLRAGMAVIVAALLLLPGAWSISEAANVSLNTTLPQAGPRGGAAGRTFGSQAFDAGTSQLAQWLHGHSDGSARYDLVVQSAQYASTMVAQDSLAVMPLGGFSGNDPAITLAKFADLVATGDVRYVLAGNAGPSGFGGGFGGFEPPTVTPGARGSDGRGRNGQTSPQVPQGAFPGFTPGVAPFGGAARDGRGALVPGGAQPVPPPVQRGGTQAVMSAVSRSCTPVNDPTLPANYRSSLYDCSGKADALKALG
jgi:4-amino-4-deoxy-L-arabinose transferase-like glycosyltransferase